MAKPARLIRAFEAEAGVEYTDWRGRTVYKAVGPGRDGDIRVLAWSEFGEPWQEHEVPANFPLLEDGEAVKRAKNKNERQRTAKTGFIQRSLSGTAEKAKMGDGTRRARGHADPRTGYGVGTTGHAVGEVLLRHGCDRAKAWPDLVAMMEEQFGEPKKAKAMAHSWWSTLTRRKPELYRPR